MCDDQATVRGDTGDRWEGQSDVPWSAADECLHDGWGGADKDGWQRSAAWWQPRRRGLGDEETSAGSGVGRNDTREGSGQGG